MVVQAGTSNPLRHSHVENPLKLQVSKTLNALYAAKAYESSGCHATFDIDVRDPAHVGILDHLDAQGVVECVKRSESVLSWRITGFGEGAIETCSQVAPSEKACAIRSDVSLKQMTTLELLTVLESKRWKARVWRQEGGDLRPPAVRVAGGDCGPKVWWVKPTHKTISKAYLKCLAQIESMPNCTIEHFRRNAYYRELMCTKKLKVSSDMGLAVPDDEDAAVKKKRRTGTQAVRHAVDGEAEANKRSRGIAIHEKTSRGAAPSSLSNRPIHGRLRAPDEAVPMKISRRNSRRADRPDVTKMMGRSRFCCV